MIRISLYAPLGRSIESQAIRNNRHVLNTKENGEIETMSLLQNPLSLIPTT
jgi:hypothetical protein